jgi:hypothetical protein
MSAPSSLSTKPKPKPRNRSKTKVDIDNAILRLQKRNEPINIAAVAREAGVTSALIHNTYPDQAEQIRQLMGKGSREQRDASRQALVSEKDASRVLREENKLLRADLEKLASINQKLLLELSVLRGVAAGKVVQIGRTSA